DLDRGTESRLTFSGNTATTPVWSPDGKRFAYSVANSEGGMTIRIASSDGLGAQDSIRIPSRMGTYGLSEWSPAGSVILGSGGGHTWAVPTEGATRVAAFLVDSTLFAVQGRLSPA